MAFFQSNSLWVREFAKGVAVLQLDPGGKSVRLSLELLDELDQAIQSVEAEKKFRLLIVRSLKPASFCQGPDFAQWRGMRVPEDFQQWVERGQRLWNRLHQLRIPTIAWVQGACLGAGLELALACDRVIAIEKPATVFGFTELDFGLIPSWGSLGTLVRRVGLERSSPVVFAGRRYSAKAATQLGLADLLVVDAEPEYERLAELARKRDPNQWARHSWRHHLLERFAWGRRMILRNIAKVQASRLPEDLSAPRVALETLGTFLNQGQEAGQAAAREALPRLAQSPAFGNLLRLHDLRDRHRVPGGKLGTPQKAKTIGVIGATPLGLHLLVEITRRGDQAILRESNEARLGIGILNLVKALNQEIAEGRLSPAETQRCLSRIRSTITWKNYEETDLVVDTRVAEGAVEKSLEEVAAHVPATALIALTTPACKLDAACQKVGHPERIVGFHPFGPVGQYAVAEVRRTSATADPVFRKLREWATGVGYLPVTVGDQSGLLLARLWVPVWNELILLLREGAKIERIDQALARFGLGQSLFQHLDRLGLEAVGKLVDLVREELTPRVPLDPFWEEVLPRGWTGKVASKGFYRYHRRRAQPNQLLSNWLHLESSALPIPTTDQARFIQDRIVLLSINEAYRCLEEERVENADDLDLAMMLTDWAPHHGGPIRYAEQTGLGRVLDGLKRMEVYGPRYVPCRLLTEGNHRPDA